MAKYSAKQKDDLLRHLKKSVFLPKGQEYEEMASGLVADNLVIRIIPPVTMTEQYHITDKGIKFIDNGGYAKQRNKKILGYIYKILILIATTSGAWCLIQCYSKNDVNKETSSITTATDTIPPDTTHIITMSNQNENAYGKGTIDPGKYRTLPATVE